jgi:hypothetical protein
MLNFTASWKLHLAHGTCKKFIIADFAVFIVITTPENLFTTGVPTAHLQIIQHLHDQRVLRTRIPQVF